MFSIIIISCWTIAITKIKYKKALENVKVGKAQNIQPKGHNKGH
ncbi:hypothetical protein LPICM17_550016 [Lactococcus piscium]|nr:hypothetical protein LPICM17_550016 [Lactococcus piscium]